MNPWQSENFPSSALDRCVTLSRCSPFLRPVSSLERQEDPLPSCLYFPSPPGALP
jgi:hypothetical protein